MNYLISGGSGFIGSHLIDRLLKDNHKVTIIDRSIKWENIKHNEKNPNFRIYHRDIFDAVPISDLFCDIDIVIHMAALTRPQWSIQYPYETSQANILGTIRMLELSKDNNIKRFIFLSTSNVYGNTYFPTYENAPLYPMNSYALSKFVGEQYCQLFQQLYGLEYNVIRPFNAYGSRMPISGIYTSAVATYINALKNNIPFIKFGDGNQRRDFVYIDDVVEQIVLMANSQVCNQIYNCGFGKNYSINEVLSIIREIMGKKGEPQIQKKQYEPDQTLADISKAEMLLNWKPKVDLYEGLKKTIELWIK